MENLIKTKENSTDMSRFSAHKDGIISGYASVFNVTDAYNDVVQKGAFADAVDQFNKGKKPKLLWQHDVHYPIGIIEEMREDDYGLFIKAKLLLDLPQVRDIYCLLKNNAINGFSIGYRIDKKLDQDGKQILSKINLLEVSVVTFPACESAVISNVKNIGENKMNTEIQNEINKLNTNINNYILSSNKKIAEIQRNIIGKNMPLSGNVDEAMSKKDFENYLRTGIGNFSKKSLSESDEHGALLLPQEVIDRINEKIKYLSPMRSISRVMHVSGNSIDLLVDEKSMDAGWAGKDSSERKETSTPHLRKITIPVHEIYARPKASKRLLDDAKIDVEQWLINKIAEKFAMLENQAFINGAGEDRPQGFLQCKTSVEVERDFDVLQMFYTGAKGKFQDKQSAINILIDVSCSLKPVYVKNAKWLMSRSALAAVRKLKNGDGVGIWQPAFAESAPSTLLGYPVIIDDDMPELVEGTGAKAIAFGDFSSGYQIVDRQGLSVLRDPYTSKPFVEFYSSKRTGGAVVDFDAIKILNFDVSE